MTHPVVQPGKTKTPVVLTPHQKMAQTKARKKAEADALEKANAARLAQIVNLHIAGFSLSDIGAAIGATAEEVDRLLQRDAARYVRSQPALRVYVRNWISERYTKMLEADWAEATDKNAAAKLENQDRVLRILDQMRRLHGADAPVQSEIKVDAAPEAVERLVNALATQSGYGYDTSVFDAVGDTVDGEVVEDAVEQSHAALELASARVAEPDDNDQEFGPDDE